MPWQYPCQNQTASVTQRFVYDTTICSHLYLHSCPHLFLYFQCHWKYCSTGCFKRSFPLDYVCNKVGCFNLFHQNCALQWELNVKYEEGKGQLFCMYWHTESTDALKNIQDPPPMDNNPTHNLPVLKAKKKPSVEDDKSSRCSESS